jgi:3-oxoacyl-[acyl-carrier-protein] synthase II
MGAITPLGNDVAALWKGCLESRSGVSEITSFDASRLPCHIAGEARDFRAEDWLTYKECRRLPRFAQLALAATDQAVSQSKLVIADEDPDRVGVVLGNGSGGATLLHQPVLTLDRKGWAYCDPLTLLKTLSDMATATISARVGSRGYISTIAASCASGAIAIGHSADVIRSGRADVIVTGSTEAWLNELGIASFALLRALTGRNSEPSKASRPFDADRDGFVPAEGAAMFVLEELEHALERGAEPLAEVKGFAVTSDASHLVMPLRDGSSAAKSITLALGDAGISTADVGYINAHGTSTKLNDIAETKAIHTALGEAAGRIPVSATKSLIGHSLGAAAAIETAICIKSLQEQLIHPTVNLDSPDPSCLLNHVTGGPRPASIRNVLNISFAFGGQNACLVLGAV